MLKRLVTALAAIPSLESRREENQALLTSCSLSPLHIVSFSTGHQARGGLEPLPGTQIPEKQPQISLCQAL